ncbi:MAG: DUF2344 domain-containing protein [Clostridia bacterium]|nr:DUF2344 domain-containing protein [Clostridia bacterium]
MDQPIVEALRCRFTKTGPIRFISHLDLTRAFHRALARAEIPLKFSEGFSPHPKFTFALPLSVGMESLCEAADFSLKEGVWMAPDEVAARLQAEMPAGITLLSVSPAAEKLSAVAYVRYRVLLPRTPADRKAAVEAALAGDLSVEKKNKKGKTVTKDLRPGIRRAAVSAENGALALELVLSARGDSVVGPDMVLTALAEKVPGFDRAARRTTRLALLREDESVF